MAIVLHLDAHHFLMRIDGKVHCEGAHRLFMTVEPARVRSNEPKHATYVGWMAGSD